MKSMSYVAIIVTIALLISALGGGTSFAGGPMPGDTQHIRFAGRGADAGWTNCPPEPVPYEVYTDTYISVAEQMYQENGTRLPSTTLYLSEYRYMFDGQGNWIFVSDTSGNGEASLAVDKKLTGASASATVLVTTCTVDQDGNWICTDGGMVTVNASWTGVGDLTKSQGTYHSSLPGSKYHSHWKGTSRCGTASGQVSGTDLGASSSASLYDTKSADIYVTHGGH